MVYNKIVDEDVLQIIEENKKLQELDNCTVMITGATGMLGSYFLYTLVKLNEELGKNITIVPVMRNINKLDPELLNKDYIKPVVGDVTEPINYNGDIDYIIHAASPASPKIMKDHPVETNFANTLGTANTLKLAKDKNVKGYLYISSREIYGQPNPGQKYFTEYGSLGQVNPLVPRNGYAEGKKAAENMCSGFREEYGVPTFIGRLAHTYGPGMSIDDGRVQADFLKDVVNNRNIVMKSEGTSVRTYTYVADAVSALYKILLEGKDMVYNVADERNETSIKELAETLTSIYPEKELKVVIDIPEEDKSNKKGEASFTEGILSTEKIRNELGWNAKYNIKDGFKRTLEYLNLELEKKHTHNK